MFGHLKLFFGGKNSERKFKKYILCISYRYSQRELLSEMHIDKLIIKTQTVWCSSCSFRIAKKCTEIRNLCLYTPTIPK